MADTFVKNPKLIVGTQAQVKAEMGANDIGFATDVEFYTAKQIDELLEKSGGASLPILMPMWSDHVINNMSWLRADTFSWQSGDVYKAAYEHLVADYENIAGETLYAWGNGVGYYFYTLSESPSVGDSVYDSSGVLDSSYSVINVANGGIYVGEDEVSSLLYTRDSSRDTKFPQTETIGDITITYYQAEDGHKICLPDQESNIVAWYEKTGAADYYLLDTTNKRFKLPRKQKRTLIQAVKNTDGTWYNLYSDGWVEQGGICPSLGYTVTFPVVMADVNYTALGTARNTTGNYAIRVQNITTTGIKLNSSASDQHEIWWKVSGMAAESVYASASMRLEYYYVGGFAQEAIEQTAGITTETLSDKADVDANNFNLIGQRNIVAMGRQFTNVDKVIATGDVGIAGTYTLAFTDNRVKIGIFDCALLTTQSGFSSVAISTDVVTTPIRVAGTNNMFRNDGALTIPFINNITISFPDTSAGIGNGTTVRFIGYM